MLRFTGADAQYRQSTLADDFLLPRDNRAPSIETVYLGLGLLVDEAVADTNPLVAKLGGLVSLGADEKIALDQLCRSSRLLRADQLLVREGEQSDQVGLILEGMAYRYRHLANGQRQILGYLIPGDICAPDFLIRQDSDHDVAVLSEARVAMMPAAELVRLMDRFPAIQRAFLLATLVDGAILREWLTNVAQRGAYERVGNFLCEMTVRLGAVGQVDRDGSFPFPLNQEMLADTTGLTTVHVNRTLQRLRLEGLIVLRQRRLTIIDPERLAAVAGFNRQYLQIAA